MPLLNKLFGKSKSAVGRVEIPKKAAAARGEPRPVGREPVKKVAEFSDKRESASRGKSDGVLISPLATEKAVSGQILNKYIFKVAPRANKIDVIRAISKIYNVKAVSANIINIPRKVRLVGKTKGFKSGYKKAIVTLTKGQSIEVK